MVPQRLVMTVKLPVRSDQQHLGIATLDFVWAEMRPERVTGKKVGVDRHARVKADAATETAVIEKDSNAAPFRKIDAVRLGDVQIIGVCLPGGQDRKLDPLVCQGTEGLGVNSGFREPHPLRLPPKTVLELGDTPDDLRAFIPL